MHRPSNQITQTFALMRPAHELDAITASGGGCGCPSETAVLAAETLALDPDPTPSSVPWSGVIVLENELTGDGRFIETDALRWDTLPIPLRYVPVDVGAHDGAQVVGRILTITRGDGGKIEATGDFDMTSEIGREAARHVDEGLTTGVSVDMDSISFEIRVAKELLDGMMESPTDDELDEAAEPAVEVEEVDADGRVTVAKIKSDDEIMVTTDGRIRAATMVAIPAFEGARISLDSALDESEVVAGGSEHVSLAHGTTKSADSGKILGEGGREGSGGLLAMDGNPDGDPVESSGPVRADASRGSGSTGQETGRTSDRLRVANRAHSTGADCGSHVRGNALPERGASGSRDLRREHSAPVGSGRSTYGVSAGSSSDAGEHVLQDAWDFEGGDVRSLQAGGFPVAPPQAWFDNPGLSEPTPLVVTPEGRVYGHLAVWNTCHTAYSGQCVEPPHSPSAYSYFRNGSVLTAEGSEIPTGVITLDTLHAGGKLSAAQTMAHYEHTGRGVVDVSAGEDVHGIWVSGAVRPDVTPEQIRSLRASPLSGDWRRMGGNLELVAALAVNVPGFPIPRPSGLVASGVMTSLVASGMVAPKRVLAPGTPGALTTDDLRYLKGLAARERRAEAEEKVGIQSKADEMAARIRSTRAAVLARRVGVS